MLKENILLLNDILQVPRPQNDIMSPSLAYECKFLKKKVWQLKLASAVFILFLIADHQ